jgi:hypothetical protein
MKPTSRRSTINVDGPGHQPSLNIGSFLAFHLGMLAPSAIRR